MDQRKKNGMKMIDDGVVAVVDLQQAMEEMKEKCLTLIFVVVEDPAVVVGMPGDAMLVVVAVVLIVVVAVVQLVLQ